MSAAGLAAESPFAGGSGKGSSRRVSAVTAMLVGALSGALLLKVEIWVPLAFAAALAAVTGLLYVPAARRYAGEGAAV